MTQNSHRYTKVAVLLHWFIAIFMVLMFVLGWFMTDIPKDAPKQVAFDVFDLGIYTWQMTEPVSPKTFYFNLHKSLGITIFALILIRILWRLTHKPPAFLASYTDLERKMAVGAHHLLYLLMVAIPLTGVLMSLNSKFGISWFGMEFLSGTDDKPARELFEGVHEIVGLIFLAVLALHLAGALKHKFIDKDETMKRMSL